MLPSEFHSGVDQPEMIDGLLPLEQAVWRYIKKKTKVHPPVSRGEIMVEVVGTIGGVTPPEANAAISSLLYDGYIYEPHEDDEFYVVENLASE